MIISIFLKVFSDACLCLGLLGTFSAVFPAEYPPVYAALLCGAGVALSCFLDKTGKPGRKLAGIILPVCTVAFVRDPSSLWLLLPVSCYSIFLILRGKYYLEYHSFRNNFRVSLIVLAALYVALSALAYMERLASPEYTVIDSTVLLRYGIVYAVCGVFLQRYLRLGAENRALGTGGQLVGLFALIAGAVLVLTMAGSALKSTVTLIFKALLHVALLIPSLIYSFFVFLINREDVDKMQEAVKEAADATMPSAEPVLQKYIYEAMQAPSNEPSYWWAVLVVLMVCAVMVWLLLAYRNRVNQAQSEEVTGTVSAGKPPARESRRSNRGRIRHAYREYLRIQRKRGAVLKKNMTTEDILRQSSYGTDEAAASLLREVYLPARYCHSCDISKQQVETANEALRKIR